MRHRPIVRLGASTRGSGRCNRDSLAAQPRQMPYHAEAAADERSLQLPTTHQRVHPRTITPPLRSGHWQLDLIRTYRVGDHELLLNVIE
jgi:hypothetical protein